MAHRSRFRAFWKLIKPRADVLALAAEFRKARESRHGTLTYTLTYIYIYMYIYIFIYICICAGTIRLGQVHGHPPALA
jgi:hypothetical protein